jgi:hypothetical protein
MTRSIRRLLFAAQLFAVSFVYDLATGQSWEMIAPMLTVRGGFPAVALHDNRILVIGGYDGTNVLSECEIYDPKTNTWSVTGSLNTARMDFEAQTLQDGRVLIAGGLTGLGLATSNTCELYDPATGTWKVTAPMSDRRELFTSMVLPDGTVLLCGGLDAQAYGYLNSVDEFDPKTETMHRLPNMHVGLYAETMFFSPESNGVVVCGGQFLGWDGYFLRSNELFRFSDSTWVLLDSCIVPQSDGGQAVQLPDDRYLLISGRSGPDFATDTVESFDPHTLLWTQQPPLARIHWNGKTFFWAGDTLLVAGGIDDPHVYLDQLSYSTFYDIRTGASWDGPALNVPRACPGIEIDDYSADSCSPKKTFYMIGGGGRNNTLLSSCEKLDIGERPITAGLSVSPAYYSFDRSTPCESENSIVTISNSGCSSITLDSITNLNGAIQFSPTTLPLVVSPSQTVSFPFKYIAAIDSGYTNVTFAFSTMGGAEQRYMHVVHATKIGNTSNLITNPAPITHGHLNQTVSYPMPVLFPNSINVDSLLRSTTSFQFQLTFDTTELQVSSVTPPKGWSLKSESINGDTLFASFSKSSSSVHLLDTLGAIVFNVIDVQDRHTTLNLVGFSVKDSSGVVPFCITAAEGGVWVILLDSGLSSVSANNIAPNISEVFPNPTHGNSELDIQLETPGKISIRVYDILGREEKSLATHMDGHVGRNILAIPSNTLAEGVYMVRTAFAGGVVTREMHVER